MKETKFYISKDELSQSYTYLIDFFNQKEFQSLVSELFELEENDRFKFVKNIILNKNELLKRGIDTPKDILIQRSYFYDNRPTLFCLTKFLTDKKRKVTITIDSDSFKGRPEAQLPTAPTQKWRLSG